MIAPRITGRTLLFLLAPGFERATYVSLSKCLEIQGGRVINCSYTAGDTLTSADRRLHVTSDSSFARVAEEQPEQDAVLVVDNVTASATRDDAAALKVIARAWAAGRLVVLVDEATRLAVSAGIAENQTLAAPPPLARELLQAGARLAATPIAVSGNLCTATAQARLSALCEEIVQRLQEREPATT